MKNNKILIPVFAFLLLLSSAFIVVDPGYKPGDKAIDFKLKNVDGKLVSLRDENYNDAKGFIIVFTCNHCPFSKAYENRIIELNQKYSTSGYPVIAINSNNAEVSPEDSYDFMIKRAAEKEFKFPYLYDESQAIAKAYGANHTPHVFVLQKVGRDLIVKYMGAIDDNTDNPEEVTKYYVNDAINSLLAGEPVAVPSTKSIGCTIKWKKS